MNIPLITEIEENKDSWDHVKAMHKTLGIYAGKHKLEIKGLLGFIRDDLGRFWVKLITTKELGEDKCTAFNLNIRDTHTSLMMIPDAQVAHKDDGVIICVENLFIKGYL